MVNIRFVFPLRELGYVTAEQWVAWRHCASVGAPVSVLGAPHSMLSLDYCLCEVLHALPVTIWIPSGFFFFPHISKKILNEHAGRTIALKSE